MVEFKIQIEESIVQTMGYQKIETSLQEFIKKAVLKIVAQDILRFEKY